MFVFNSQMHLITVIISLLEFGMFCYQLVYCLSDPSRKERLWYLILLALLIVYNVSGGLLPDPRFRMSVILQNVLAYGSGFLMGAYFPFYFYKAFDLERLRWHLHYTLPVLLGLPYLIFFCVVYPLSGNLDFATSYGMIGPGLYTVVILYAILNAIRFEFKRRRSAGQRLTGMEMFWVYAAVSPWALMTVFVYLHIDQWIEVLVTNLGFLIITVLFIVRTVRFERVRDEQLEAKYTVGSGASVFECNCAFYGLTKREVEIAVRISQGKQYKYIADELFISLDTVKSHVKNIFRKVEVNDKTELVFKLSQESDQEAI